MNYLSICSGIEAATVAWHPLGWKAVAFSEIEKFPCAVLEYHFPDVPNLGDMTKYKEWDIESTIDTLVGGTPCQSFSIAGLRKGMDDPRGNLALVFLGIAERFRPRWVVWENVPGVLSSGKGRDFGSFIGGLVQLGYHCTWRVLDAQYFGVPQRRRRVFVVGYLGDWRPAAAVLFECHSLSGNPPPCRKEGEKVAYSVRSCPSHSGGKGDGGVNTDLIVNALTESGVGTCGADDNQAQAGHIIMAHGQASAEIMKDGCPSLSCNHEAPIITHSLQSRHDSSEDGTGRGVPIIALQSNMVGRADNAGCNGCGWNESGVAYTHDTVGVQAVAFAQNTRNEVREMEIPGALAGQPGMKQQSYIRQSSTVRRLTPRECERLQGFPDDWTFIPWRGKPAEQCPDGPRYKAIGNSMAVPVMAWLGKRIQMVEAIL